MAGWMRIASLMTADLGNDEGQLQGPAYLVEQPPPPHIDQDLHVGQPDGFGVGDGIRGPTLSDGGLDLGLEPVLRRWILSEVVEDGRDGNGRRIRARDAVVAPSPLSAVEYVPDSGILGLLSHLHVRGRDGNDFIHAEGRRILLVCLEELVKDVLAIHRVFLPLLDPLQGELEDLVRLLDAREQLWEEGVSEQEFVNPGELPNLRLSRLSSKVDFDQLTIDDLPAIHIPKSYQWPQ